MSDSGSDIMGWQKTEHERDNYSPRMVNKRGYLSDSITEEPTLKRQKSSHSITNKKLTNESSIGLITQPPMLLFKHFLNQQEDNILVEDAMRKYNEYKESFACEQLESFFEAHKDEEWFIEKYHPDYVSITENNRLQSVENRRKVFMWLYERNWMDDVFIHINYQDALIKLFDAVSILLEGGNENDLQVLEKKVYKEESPDRTEIKIDLKHDTNGLKWDDFHTSSAEEDSDIEITSGKKVDNNDSGLEDEEKQIQQIKNTSVNELVLDNEVTEDLVTNELSTEENIDPRPLHKTCSIFLRNIHPKVFRSQIEEIVKPFSGYLRLALQDPMPERNFLRRGWVTFERSSDINNAVWQLNKAPLLDVDIGALVNKEITQRIRPVESVTNHRAIMRQDVKYAAKLVARFDKKRQLWESSTTMTIDTNLSMIEINPLLRNITEYLVDEGSYEEEAYLGGDISNNLAITGGNYASNSRLDEDQDLAKVLDRIILYLRIVHSYDYYSATEYDIEDQLPNRCGLIHVRGNLVFPDNHLSQLHLENYMKNFESKAELVLDSIDNLDFGVASRLGVKSIDDAVEKFIAENTKEITNEKFLCPLSGKKFKGSDYVRKHILNKFNDRIENVKQTVQFLNNYILDPRRPQLPEHPSNRPSITSKLFKLHEYDQDCGNNSMSRPYRNIRGENSYRKGNSRPDFGNRSNPQGSGSYYSRKICNYNDISVAD